jgi:hypothetical protein
MNPCCFIAPASPEAAMIYLIAAILIWLVAF